MIGLLVGSLLLTPVSAGVTDNLNTALVSVLSKIADSIGTNSSKPTVQESLDGMQDSMSKLNKLDKLDKLDKIDDMTKSLNRLALSESMTSFDKVSFAGASWATVHDILQNSSLEYCTWKVGDKKLMGNVEVAIMKLTFNSDGPDEIQLAAVKGVGGYGFGSGKAKCDNFYKDVKTLTGVDCGVRSWMPDLGEIPSDFGADVHWTTRLGAVGDRFLYAGNGCGKSVNRITCEYHWYKEYYYYTSDGKVGGVNYGTVYGDSAHVAKMYFHSNSDAAWNAQWFQSDLLGDDQGCQNICPIVVIN